MTTITVHPEHVDGLRVLIEQEFEIACEALDVEAIEELIAVGKQVGWRQSWQPWEHEPIEARLSAELLDKLTAQAWQVGNERMSDIYAARGRGRQHQLGPNGQQLEREARSMLAFHEHVRGQGVVV